jgi:hypothetical protein
MGFLSDEEQEFLKTPCTWKEATAKVLGAQSDSEKDLTWAISSRATFKDTEQRSISWPALGGSVSFLTRRLPQEVTHLTGKLYLLKAFIS